jgi:hypothetical protein
LSGGATDEAGSVPRVVASAVQPERGDEVLLDVLRCELAGEHPARLPGCLQAFAEGGRFPLARTGIADGSPEEKEVLVQVEVQAGLGWTHGAMVCLPRVAQSVTPLAAVAAFLRYRHFSSSRHTRPCWPLFTGMTPVGPRSAGRCSTTPSSPPGMMNITIAVALGFLSAQSSSDRYRARSRDLPLTPEVARLATGRVSRRGR